ncbi:hypothetical protein TGME49_322120 [Toxoplasma gondii ME49]|uniref:Protein kinase domain-containing protein n=1 Tax=Toxoplasma gondii (strain ATCC 50611 / Me49) TaxID=508771 RepID=S8EU81_TOXGM|nr:hypothetical protein TGME49_322120 [Toxoplasma gondii ME49]EPT24528.1 hypothetical protein TGME49_322120 [Toxoplasma gondii ME49]|eukprot:XP_018634759.1 hypothetical protein TGME49_322120 [Toxoplasma gondii ME49]
MFPRVALFPVPTCDLFLVGRSRLSRAAKLHLTRQLVVSVAWLHRHGVAHNDLKLENVFPSEEGKAVIGDLGFGVQIGTSARLKYTAAYLDPHAAEECLNNQVETVANEGTGAWALGTLVFVIWCRSYPVVSREQACLSTRDLRDRLVTMAKTTKPTPSSHHCQELPSPVKDLIAGFLQWSREARRLPGDDVDEFLAATLLLQSQKQRPPQRVCDTDNCHIQITATVIPKTNHWFTILTTGKSGRPIDFLIYEIGRGLTGIRGQE